MRFLPDGDLAIINASRRIAFLDRFWPAIGPAPDRTSKAQRDEAFDRSPGSLAGGGLGRWAH